MPAAYLTIISVIALMAECDCRCG